MSKNCYWLFALLMMGLLSPPTFSANAPSDSGSKEALKESAIRDTDKFTGKEFMVFESVKNEGYENEKQFSKMTFYVAPLFRLIPDPDTQAVYQKTPYSHRGIVQYTFFVECFHPRIDEQALKKVNKYYSKTEGEYVFTEEQVHHMRHGKVVIEAANLPDWVKVKPVVIGTDSANSTVMLDAVEEFTVDVPLDMDKDFQTRLDSGMKFKFVVYFNVMNLSQLNVSWSVNDIRKTSTYKQIKSGGAHYVTAEQVHNMTRQVAEKRKAYYYQDPGIDDKIVEKALSLFDRMHDDTQELTVQNHQQAAELEAKLLEGTGLSPSEFKPLTLMWDVYEKLETVDDYTTANKVIQEAYQRSQQAYQQLDKASQNSLNAKAGFDYNISLTGLSGEGNAYYEHDYQNTESSKQRSSKEDKINKGYFENADALKAYQAKTTEQKRPEVKIVGRGLNVIEKAQFEQNISSMASFVFVQPMTQAKSFMTDAKISTHSTNEVPSMLEKLKKAALLTDAVSVSEDGKVGIGTDTPEAVLELQTEQVYGDRGYGNFYYNKASGLKITARHGQMVLKMSEDNPDSARGGNAIFTMVNGSDKFLGGIGYTKGDFSWCYDASNCTGYEDESIHIRTGDTNGGIVFGVGNNAEKKDRVAMYVKSDGNVGIGTTDPKAKLDVNGNFIRTITYATGNGPNDQTDVGQIKSRILSFSKVKANTKIRIGYTDNLRTYGVVQKACRWEIRIDGKSCPSQALVYDDHVETKDNTHSSRTVVGYCSGIAAGSHTIGIWVSHVPEPRFSGSDCYTGWNNSTWVIEAEEVN
ncbi:secreted protein [Beggiatoa sp. PS]|nr:secreted protein [Beggiatoa sp. PS]